MVEPRRDLLVLGVGVSAGITLACLLRKRLAADRILLLKAVEGETIRVPADEKTAFAANVVRAFYGHPANLWNKSKGADVTDKVRRVLEEGGRLRADNRLFGDPIPGYTKVLVVEVKSNAGRVTLMDDADDTDGIAVTSKPCSTDLVTNTNIVPTRPTHYAVRPDADPRLDPAMYVRYDAAPGHKTGAIIIVCPGGNYDECGIDGGEGQAVAQWLVRYGVTAIVLKYRCVSKGHYWPAQFEDWAACAQQVKGAACSWGCDPERIGVMGFSAGGHLAGYAALAASSEILPKLQILVYPAIDALSPHDSGVMDAWRADQGHPSIEDSINLLDSSNAPPTFMAGVSGDRCTPVAENTDVYARILEEHGVPCEYVVNEDEAEDHGCGLKEWWTTPCAAWLGSHGWARPLDGNKSVS